MFKKIRPFLLSAAILVFVSSAFMLINHFYNVYRNNKSYDEIKEVYNIEDSFRFQDSNTQLTQEEIEAELNKMREERFKVLQELNDEVVAWIYIPGTKINYPVVRADNNDYYLNHNAEKKSNKAGAIFMDYHNKVDKKNGINDKNIVIYGHNMKDGSMFSGLRNYKDKEFYTNNKYIYMDTESGRKKFEIFSVFVTKTDFNYIKTDFKESKEYAEFLKSVENKSLYKTEAVPSPEDQIITLSTCTYEYDDARLVVAGKLIK